MNQAQYMIWRLKMVNTPVILPPPNYKLLSLRLKLAKREGLFPTIANQLGVQEGVLNQWMYLISKPRKKGLYDKVMNLLESA